jgi:transketolase
MNRNSLKNSKKECLLTLLSLYKKANAGHIGASLSCLDILVYLHLSKMTNDDKFVLSKGHAAVGLYVVLAQADYFDKALLDTYYLNGTMLAAHPPCGKKVNGIHFGTGSLGHGFSLATGLAFSNRFTKKNNNVYCIVSEGDCNEGSTWEAALFAAQHKLKNLYLIIDNNKLQGFGNMEDVLNLEPFADKWKAFNFDVEIAENGNDFDSLHTAFEKLENRNSDKPKCIIALTKKGNGVSYMENKMEWHYLPMSDELYSQALKEVNNQ